MPGHRHIGGGRAVVGDDDDRSSAVARCGHAAEHLLVPGPILDLMDPGAPSHSHLARRGASKTPPHHIHARHQAGQLPGKLQHRLLRAAASCRYPGENYVRNHREVPPVRESGLC